MIFHYALQYLYVISPEKVELATIFLNGSRQLLQGLDHELHTMMREILVHLGVDLHRREDKNGSYFLELFELTDQ